MSEVEKLKKATEYFNGDELAAEVWLTKYALRNEKSPVDSIARYAKELYRIELNYPNPLSYEEIEERLGKYEYKKLFLE